MDGGGRGVDGVGREGGSCGDGGDGGNGGGRVCAGRGHCLRLAPSGAVGVKLGQRLLDSSVLKRLGIGARAARQLQLEDSLHLTVGGVLIPELVPHAHSSGKVGIIPKSGRNAGRHARVTLGLRLPGRFLPCSIAAEHAA